MTKKERVRFEMFIRVVQFIRDLGGIFPAGSIVAVQLAVLEAVINTVQTLTGEQTTGLADASFGFNSKDTARENLREMLSEIARTARSMVYAFPGINLKFRMLQGDSDVKLLALGRSFLTEATPLKDAFLQYGMDSHSDEATHTDFLTILQELVDDFEQSLSAPGTAIDAHVEATAEIGAEIRKGMIAVRTMDGVIKNKFRNDVGKLAAWLSASHIEKISAAEKPTQPNQPNP
jgi:hypothetical protein